MGTDDRSSDVLVPHRVVGRVSGHVPAVYQPLPGTANLGYISFPINNAVFTYKVRPLTLAWISEPVTSDIRVVARNKSLIFAADDSGVDVLNFNGARIKRILDGKLRSRIRFLVVMGNVLVCIEESGLINVVDVPSGDILVEIETPSNFSVSSAFHPDTYYNKIVLASTDGRIRIVNINTGKLVHEFQQDSLFNRAITCMVQSPAKDVIAFGLDDGNIHMRNLKTGEVLFSFRQDGAVTGIAFRTDGIETMASTNSDGTIALWNLTERVLIGQKTAAHAGRIHSVFFLLGQPNMITFGDDNKMVRWYMETEISMPVVNKSIAGHKGEVTAIKFFIDSSVLTAGVDGYVRKFNIYRGDKISTLGVAREVKKSEVSKDRFIDVRLEPIVDMKLEKMREHVWDNIICAHRDSALVSTWSSRRYTKGNHLFCHPRFTKESRLLSASVSALELSNSGDFAFIGYTSGHVDVYNMQSGRYKFSLENPAFKTTKQESSRAHKDRIVIICSYLNSKDVITVAANGSIAWWELEASAKMKKTATIGEVVSVAAFNRESRLLALGLRDSNSVRVLDAETGDVARKFKKIASLDGDFTLLEFSSDSTYLLAADTSAIIRVIDLKSASVVGSVKCSSPCRKAAFSENDLYLATCHEGHSEVFIWTNRLKYSGIRYQRKPDENLQIRDLSSFAGAIVDENIDFDLDDEENEDGNAVAINKLLQGARSLVIDDESDIEIMNDSLEVDYSGVANIAEEPELFTLSGEPSHRWATLPYIDIIKNRNTIKEIVKKPINIPFFLESTPNESDILVAEQNNRSVIASDRTDDEIWTEWAHKLSSAALPGDFGVCFNSLVEMSTPKIDSEIRSLPNSLTVQFLRMLSTKLKERQQIDFVHAILCTFIRVHQSRFLSYTPKEEERRSENEENIAVPLSASDLTKELDELYESLVGSKQKLEELFDETLPVLKWIKSALT